MVSDTNHTNLCVVKVVRLRDGDTKIENTSTYLSLETLIALTWHIFTIILELNHNRLF